MHSSFEEADLSDFSEEKPTVKKKHRVFWAELYDRLTDYEANSLDSVMDRASFRPGQIIYKQGGINRNLYLFELGQAKHIYTQHGRETFIKKIKPGNIAGEDNFFHDSCCTTTLIAIDKVIVRFTSADRLKEAIDAYDGLEEKIKAFCAREVKICDLLKRNAQDRRQHQRVPFQGPILIKPVDTSLAAPAKSLRGEIRDVSCGGMAVVVKLDDRQQAQALLGNNFKARFNLPPNMNAIERIGQVLGVSRQEENAADQERQNNYSINLKFIEPVPEESISEYARYVKRLGVVGA